MEASSLMGSADRDWFVVGAGQRGAYVAAGDVNGDGVHAQGDGTSAGFLDDDGPSTLLLGGAGDSLEPAQGFVLDLEGEVAGQLVKGTDADAFGDSDGDFDIDVPDL